MYARLTLPVLICIGCGTEPAPSDNRSRLASEPLVVPRPASAKVLSHKPADDRYALEIWCIDRDAPAEITSALARDGWTEIRTTGTPPAIAATRGELRFSAKPSQHAERCAGTYLTATVMRLGR